MVCEGEKTETSYLEDLRKRWRIPTATWTILPSNFGTGPEKVVLYAKSLAREKKAWDEVYCIFDRDDHEHYREALVQARDLDGTIRIEDSDSRAAFYAIPSVPCFELWFLLHFREVTREMDRHEAKRILTSFIPGYEKSSPDMFAKTLRGLEDAYARAAEERIRRRETGNDNPSTDMDILVKRLFEIGAMKEAYTNSPTAHRSVKVLASKRWWSEA
jgi:hypothetical protein